MGIFGSRIGGQIGCPRLWSGLPISDRTPRQEIVARPPYSSDGPIFIVGTFYWAIYTTLTMFDLIMLLDTTGSSWSA